MATGIETMMRDGMSNLDADGFSVSVPSNGRGPRKPPPPTVAVPKFFDGCDSQHAAIVKMVDELGKPAAVQIDGFDTMYRRMADALILLLAIEGGLAP
jgi:hypothetical protein